MLASWIRTKKQFYQLNHLLKSWRSTGCMLALQITSCGLRLYNLAVCIAVALLLGLDVHGTSPHTSRRVSQVAATGMLGLGRERICWSTRGKLLKDQVVVRELQIRLPAIRASTNSTTLGPIAGSSVHNHRHIDYQ